MTEEQARYQSLATSCAAITTFIGVCHGAIGDTVFPWAPAFVGGLVIWHSMGILLILLGLMLLAGTLGFIKISVERWALIPVVPAIAVAVIVAVTHQQFHMFALALVLTSVGAAYFHRKAVKSAA